MILIDPSSVAGWFGELIRYNSPDQWKQDFLNAYTGTYRDPILPPVPSAPQTHGEMTDPSQWTPEIQLQRDIEAKRRWIENGVYPDPPTGLRDSETFWWFVGGAGLLAIVLLRR